jgi:hypothetical protein
VLLPICWSCKCRSMLKQALMTVKHIDCANLCSKHTKQHHYVCIKGTFRCGIISQMWHSVVGNLVVHEYVMAATDSSKGQGL